MGPGAMIGHYRVLEKLGQGGMGVVYKAFDINLDRAVALKLMSTEAVSAGDRHRFGREAKAASALNHPNIVTIYEFNNTEGAEFIAMEFVQGATLSEILKHGLMPIAQVLRIARQTADALARAHAVGIVHRDLKPGNLMLTNEGAVKVLDFGLAKRAMESTGEEGDTETALTAAGATLGTPAYMSPEQAMGEPIDQRADIFSFGAVLYELVTGKRPFGGSRRMDVLKAVLLEPAPSSSLLRPEAPVELHGLVDRCLEKDRDLRFQTMREVCRELDGISQTLDSKTSEETAIVARSISGYQSRASDTIAPGNRPARRRLYWVAAALSVAIAAALLYPRISGSPVSPSARTVVTTPRTAYEHYQLGKALLSRPDRKGNVDQAIQAFHKSIGLDGELAAAYAGLAEAFAAKNALAPDPQWIRQAREAAERAVQLNPDLALAHVSLARALLAGNQGALAAAELKRALELDARHAPAHYWMGVLLSASGDSAGAEKELRIAVRLDSGDWQNLERLGELLYKSQRYQEALTVWLQALPLALDSSVLHRHVAAAQQMLGKYDDAASHLQKALEIDPSAPVYNNLGTLRFFQGRYAEAVPAFEKAVDLRAGSYLYWANLGDAYRWAPGQRDKARTAYTRAVQIARSELASKPANAELRSRLAVYLAKLGDLPSARAELTALPVSSPSGALHFRTAIAWELLGRRGEALDALARALKAGYAPGEVENEPELVSLRADRRYHLMMASMAPPTNSR